MAPLKIAKQLGNTTEGPKIALGTEHNLPKGEPNHAVRPVGESRRLIGHLYLFLFLVFLVRESFLVTSPTTL
jgi:hypothetical protein